MNINHNSMLDVEHVALVHTEKEGVDVKYVCTTDLGGMSDRPLDVFFRATPHPHHGNKYFGISRNEFGELVICNADIIESYDFGMILDSKGVWHYSRSHHDYVEIEDKIIDGGRAYIRGTGFDIFKLVDGEFLDMIEADMRRFNLPGFQPDGKDFPDMGI